MSGDQSVAKSSHLRPAEPFPLATDVTLEGVHRSVVALTVQQTKLIDRLDKHIETDERRSGLIHEELALLRADLGLRVTSAEQGVRDAQKEAREAAKASLGTKAKPIAGYASAAVVLIGGIVELVGRIRQGGQTPLQAALDMLAAMAGIQ